jgi:hypothetical protein
MIASMALVCAYLMGGLAVSGLVLGAMTTSAEARGGRGVGRGGVGRGVGRGGGRGFGRGGGRGWGGGWGGGCRRWTPLGWVWGC